MEMNKLGVNGVNGVNGANPAFKANEVKNTSYLKQDAPTDSLEFEHKAGRKALSKEDKQEVVRSARTTAAGWSLFGGFASTLYFGLRSDKTVAKKYDLDVKEDKKLIKQIKREQILWTLPSCIQGLGAVPGFVAWMYNKNMDSSKIKVD